MRGKGLILQPLPPEAKILPQIAGAAAVPVFRRYLPGPVLDQGERPMCGGYAAAAMLNAEPIKQSYDPKKIYSKAKTLDGFPENTDGTTLFAISEALTKLGLVSQTWFADTPQAVYNHLATTSPMLISSEWLEGMENTTPLGKVYAKGASYGGHCYLAYAVDFGRKRIMFQNSWGTSWGQEGRFWMPFKEFEKLMKNTGAFGAAFKEIRLK